MFFFFSTFNKVSQTFHLSNFNNISQKVFSDQIMSKIQFLLHIHKKDLFLLPTPTEVAFNTTNSPRFYCSSNPSQPNHSSLLRINRCGILLNHRTTAFQQNSAFCHFFICFNDSPLELMRNVFYFILKGLFILKMFKFLRM